MDRGLAARWGVSPGYTDWRGRRHASPESSVAAVLEAMGAAGGRPRPGAVVLDQGRGRRLARPAELELEDGTRRRLEREIPPGLPLGYHRLTEAGSGRPTRLIVTPSTCEDAPFGWGWALQLYALRSAGSAGMGDLADLAEMARWSAAQGASMLLVNPLHAASPASPQQPSPYYPGSRAHLNPLYLRLDTVPGLAVTDAGRRAAAALNALPVIDRARVHHLKMSALEAAWLRFAGDPGFEAFRRERGATLESYATFCALSEAHPGPWRAWPAGLRRPDSAEVTAFREAHLERVGFHAWLQWLADRQLADASAHLRLVQDLAVGVDPAGADAWIWQDSFAGDFRVGAPPDEFNTAGQDWGLPPLDPWRLSVAGYEPFVQTLRAAFRHAGGLRVDHVMGLFRLYWIPPGASPAEGVYVRYPAREMLGILALESRRARAFVVGEDLGTVEPSVRTRLRRAGVLSYRLLWFERRAPERYPEAALAAVTTHDLPTIAGLWSGDDLAEQRSLGLEPNEESTREIERRLTDLSGVPAGGPVGAAVEGTYAALARAPSRLVTATLEDVLEVRRRPNMPGLTYERPNWSIPLPESLEAIEADARVARVARVLARRPGAGDSARRPGSGSG